MSEVLIAVEALNKIPKFEHAWLTEVENAIKENSHILIEINSKKSRKALLRPKKVNYISGRYLVSGYNYFTAEFEEFDIAHHDFNIIKKLFLYALPSFEETKTIFKATTINSVAIEALVATFPDNYFLITYDDFNEIRTKRIISEVKMIFDKSVPGNDVPYLKSFCNLREAQRYFKVDRIKTIKVLDIRR